ncbi:hypothetical protein CF322_09605 [Listeria monocytogenes]|nr:hypothetical protein [Listeria monocytogenes]MDA10127.1 hypothetical protein [Listeria monocytogenes serotype 4b]EAC4191126.1 hypothetical protein [Listeria monocytogenes]EAC4194085.1 hypothetical protein [Listeria monocytogenes]EAC4295831.1 hypothetical protein [Listeria monocytogenes]
MKQIPFLTKFYIVDNISHEKMEVKTMKYYDGGMPTTVEVLANPTAEKGGIISYDLRRINLHDKIPDSSKKSYWQLESRYELVMEVSE